MPMAIELVEEGIYCLRVWGISTYEDARDLPQYPGGTYNARQPMVIIINRSPDAVVDLSFPQIRMLIASRNVGNTHFLHIDNNKSLRMIIFAINKISPLNMMLVPDMETAKHRAREILSNHSSD